MAPQTDRLAHNAGAASETLHPKPMAENGDGMAAPDVVVFLREHPAHQRSYAQHVEIVAAHDAHGGSLGGAIHRQVYGVAALGQQARKDSLPFVDPAVSLVRPGHVSRRPTVAHAGGVEPD